MNKKYHVLEKLEKQRQRSKGNCKQDRAILLGHIV